MTNATADTGEIIALGGFPIRRTTNAEMVPLLQQKMQQQQVALYFANTNFVVKCQPHKEAMSREDTIIVNDGIGIDIATWLIHRKTFIENLNGTDFTPLFLRSLGASARVFLVGAKPGIAQRAAERLHSEHGVNVVGVRNGYDEAKDTKALIDAINSAEANVVLVAMGNPYQEEWIMKHRDQLNARV
ncbi:MAG TPA: WecB/TagA/CpsF family glycosyltransferase, partial [Cellvibrio sp.]|nr:WecB/TagA/CpsF family glycosyltransferase [Cellvibrio sp.]